VLHDSVNLSTVLSSSCGSVMLSGGSMGRIFVELLCTCVSLGLAKLAGKGNQGTILFL